MRRNRVEDNQFHIFDLKHHKFIRFDSPTDVT